MRSSSSRRAAGEHAALGKEEKLRITKLTGKVTFVLSLLTLGVGRASAQVTVSPTSVSFGSVALNVLGYAPRVTLTNHFTSKVSLTGITFGLPQYSVNTGLPQQTLAPGQSVQFGFIFLARKAGTYNSTITFNIQGQAGVPLSVSATGFNTRAAATLSATALDFGTVNLGSTSSSQPVTVTNTGTAALSIAAADNGADGNHLLGIYHQPFSYTGPAPPATLQPGQSATYQIAFSPVVVGPTTSTLTFCYSVLPCNAVDFTGTGASPTSGLNITSYPTLPSATQGFAYQANVTALGGKAPYRFRVQSGSMPPGLTINGTTGAITGTVTSTATVGAYTFTVQAQDNSSPRLNATQMVTLNVSAPTGANCAVTSVNVPNTSTPIVDLMDLGTGTYQGQEGGLYPYGSNIDPDPHHSDGVAIAEGLAAMPAPYVLISIGESASQQPFEEFITQANADPEKNSNLVIVDGAEGGATANIWMQSTSAYWDELINYSLPFAGVNSNQVVAAWVDDVNSQQGATFPGDAQTLQGAYETIAQLLLQKFPNIKLMLFSSLNYSGYSQGINTTLNEPQSYESAFGAKWAIQDQINGAANLNYDSANGPVLAPWMGWSFYYWGNGLIPRSDGITWSCQDLNSDGLHPSDPLGHIKIGQYLLDWFKTSDLTAPWFVQP